MSLKLYYMVVSPPARAVLLAARALDLTIDHKPINMFKGEHLTPEYAKMNPTRTIPTLDDNGFILYDSHAINGYLVSKYGKTDALYPEEVKARSVVNQRLHFDSGILFPRLSAIAFPFLRREETKISALKKAAAQEAYGFLESVLGDNRWVAGNQMTIADFSCCTTVSSLDFLVPGLQDHPKAWAWLQRCQQEMPGYKDINDVAIAKFKKVLLSMIEP